MPFKWITSSFVIAAAAGLAAATKPWLAVGGLLAMLAVIAMRRIGLWRSTYAITLILLLCATSTQPALHVISYYPRYLAAAALAAISLSRHAETTTSRRLPWSARWLLNSMFLASSVGIASAVWSADRLLTLQQSVALTILSVTIYALVTRRWTNRSLIGGDLAVAYWTLTAITTASVVINLAGFPDTATPSGRLHGVASNPNTLAMLCMLAIPLGWFVFQSQGSRFAIVGMIPSVAAVVMTGTRGAMLGLGIGLAVVIAQRGISGMARLTAAATACVGLLALVGLLGPILRSSAISGAMERFAETEGGDPLGGRSQGWSETISLIVERPIAGYGYSAGPSLFSELHQSGQLAFALNSVHNSYLQWILETGVVGLPALVGLVAACIVVAARGGSASKAAGLSWCIVGGLSLQMTESVMVGTGQAYPLVFWPVVAAGCVLAVGGQPQQPGTSRMSFSEGRMSISPNELISARNSA